MHLGSLLIIIPAPDVLCSHFWAMVKKISAWHALFNAGSKMSSVPATFKVWRAQHHDKLTLSTFGRKIYSFYFHSTWFYLLFSHLGLMADVLLPLFSVHDTVQESWTRPHLGHPVLPEWRRACECLHTRTQTHTCMHTCTDIQPEMLIYALITKGKTENIYCLKVLKSIGMAF